MTALVASPAVANAVLLAQEQHTKGLRAVIAVLLMFGALCGGVWLLLQSSFGPKQGYLIVGTAFWGCWLVLAILWFTGVPKLWPGGNVSTPRFNGPQGSEAHWTALDTPQLRARYRLPESELFEVDTSTLTDQNLVSELTSAETTAADAIADYYSKQLGTSKENIVVGQSVRIVRRAIVRHNGRVQFARIYTAAAEPTPALDETKRALLPKIQPAFFDLHFDPGSLGQPTTYALGLFTVLFLLHAGGLVRYEINRLPEDRRPQDATSRQTVRV